MCSPLSPASYPPPPGPPLLQASDKFVCIVDDSKMVTGLGGSKLAMPIEITQFCHLYTLQRLAKLPEVAGCEAKLRMDGAKPYVTDNHNFIVDLYFQTPIKVCLGVGRCVGWFEGRSMIQVVRGTLV